MHDIYPPYDPALDDLRTEPVREEGPIVTQSFETALTPLQFDLDNLFTLHSFPESGLKLYIDTKGYTCTDTYWTVDNNGEPIVAPPWCDENSSDARKAQLYRIWQQVAEDYIPFNIDVTTEEPPEGGLHISGSLDKNYGIRCVVDDDSTHWYGNAGGVAGRGTFTATRDRVCWVFANQLSNKEKSIAEAISHEVGHTLGLTHDGTNAGLTYYQGANGWAPIMGSAYYQPVTQWSKGEYPDANNVEDDLAMITSKGLVRYRENADGLSFETATVLTFS